MLRRLVHSIADLHTLYPMACGISPATGQRHNPYPGRLRQVTWTQEAICPVTGAREHIAHRSRRHDMN